MLISSSLELHHQKMYRRQMCHHQKNRQMNHHELLDSVN